MDREICQRRINDLRVGPCKYTKHEIVQCYDGASDDAFDEFGWLCLHDDTIEEELANIIKHLKEEVNYLKSQIKA